MLEVDGIDTAYGRSQVLFGMSIAVGAGEVVTLMGRNGMGKTTTVRAIMGLTPARAGRIRFCGTEIAALPPHRIARLGIGLVPEGRQIFPTLSVEENLVATARAPAATHSTDGAEACQVSPPWTLARVFQMFPRLSERRRQAGTTLSGGEQQMLAIGRALMTNPRLLILDEATEGLAPLIRAEIWAVLERLKAEGLAILLIDKNLDALLRFADRHVIVEKGRVAWTGGSAALAADHGIAHRYLGV